MNPFFWIYCMRTIHIRLELEVGTQEMAVTVL